VNSGQLLGARLWLTNGTQSGFVFNSGILQTYTTTNNNGSPFIIGNGTLSAIFELFGNGGHNFANGLLVANHALLKGNGIIVGNFTNASGGTISPGASIGKLSVAGDVVLAPGSTNVFELNATLRTNDMIVGVSNLDLRRRASRYQSQRDFE
jgi:subtilase-type serine protease